MRMGEEAKCGKSLICKGEERGSSACDAGGRSGPMMDTVGIESGEDDSKGRSKDSNDETNPPPKARAEREKGKG